MWTCTLRYWLVRTCVETLKKGGAIVDENGSEKTKCFYWKLQKLRNGLRMDSAQFRSYHLAEFNNSDSTAFQMGTDQPTGTPILQSFSFKNRSRKILELAARCR